MTMLISASSGPVKIKEKLEHIIMSPKNMTSKEEPDVQTQSDRMDSSELAMVKDHLPIPYFGFRQLTKMINERYEKVQESNASVYMSFSNITWDKLIAIERGRQNEGMHFRLTYFEDISTMIIKIITRQHESAHLSFGLDIYDEVRRMGLQRLEFMPTGAAERKVFSQYVGRTVKQGDSTYINRAIRPADDWPNLVIESGNSESLARLRMDARWWIEASKGRVSIVLCIKIDKKNQKMQIIKYIPHPTPQYPTTRNRPAVSAVEAATIFIDHSVTPPRTQGAPLMLEFQSLFDRAPSPPAESDIVFSAGSLESFAANVFSS